MWKNRKKKDQKEEGVKQKKRYSIF